MALKIVVWVPDGTKFYIQVQPHCRWFVRLWVGLPVFGLLGPVLLNWALDLHQKDIWAYGLALAWMGFSFMSVGVWIEYSNNTLLERQAIEVSLHEQMRMRRHRKKRVRLVWT